MYVGQRGQALVVQLLKGLQVFGDHLQQVVRVAEQSLRFDNLWNLRQGRLEVGDGLAGHFAQRHKHNRRKAQAQFFRRQQGPIAQNHPRLFQSPHPPMTGREAQPDPVRQFGERKTAVPMQLRENLSINSIHLEEPSNLVTNDWDKRKIILSANL